MTGGRGQRKSGHEVGTHVLGRGIKVGATAGNSDTPGRKEGGTEGARGSRNGKTCGKLWKEGMEEEKQRSGFRKPDTERKLGVKGKELMGVEQIRTQ